VPPWLHAMRTRLLDLSHAVEHGLVTYPGLPPPVIGEFLTRADSRGRYAPGTEFQIGRIEMVANTGTYVDAPSHRFAEGTDLAGLPLERLADLPGVVVDPPPGARRIGPAALPERTLGGVAVLFRTGWSHHFGTPAYGEGHPFLSGELAAELVRRGVALVGIDSLNVDDTADGERPVHTALLAAGIPIVEHLARLDALPATGFRFFAVPVRVRGLGSFPVRAFARVGPPT
jgi:arylformamidase